MSEILFSTTEFLQFLGLNEETAFWVFCVVMLSILASLITAFAIGTQSRQYDEEDKNKGTLAIVAKAAELRQRIL